MNPLHIRGRLVYRPGPWGLALPAAAAEVQVSEVEPPTQRSGHNLLWSGTTDADGCFEGTSSEWQDTISLWIPGADPHGIPLVGGHWEQRPNPLDVAILKVRVVQGNHEQECFPFVNDAPAPLVLPWGPPQNIQVPQARRVLVVLTSVVHAGCADWKPLYAFMEVAGPVLAKQILGPAYKEVATKLTGQAATLEAFLETLRAVGADASIKAIDVIFNLHGTPGYVWFADCSVKTPTLREQLQGLRLGNRLRMLYSGACYGASHLEDLTAAGCFAVASGAVGIDANQATEYPTFLALWAHGLQYRQALDIANEPHTRKIQDDLAATFTRAANLDAPDSRKEIVGKAELTIGTCAHAPII